MRKSFLLVTIAIFILILMTMAVSLIMGWTAMTVTSPTDLPLQQSKALMQAVATHPIGPIPTTLPIDGLLSGECWNDLQQAMVRNNNQYTFVVAGIYGDRGTHVPGGTGSDEVLIDVAFPDGMSVELYFYASTLNDCHLKNRE